MKYLTSAEVAIKWGLSQRRVSLLCSEGRVDGAVKAGKTWIVPESANKPSDARKSKPEGEDWDSCVVSESSVYGLDQVVAIDPVLWNDAKKASVKKGDDINQLVNDYLRKIAYGTGSSRVGLAKGAFTVCDDFDFCNDEVADLFGV